MVADKLQRRNRDQAAGAQQLNHQRARVLAVGVDQRAHHFVAPVQLEHEQRAQAADTRDDQRAAPAQQLPRQARRVTNKVRVAGARSPPLVYWLVSDSAVKPDDDHPRLGADVAAAQAALARAARPRMCPAGASRRDQGKRFVDGQKAVADDAQEADGQHQRRSWAARRSSSSSNAGV